MFRLRLTIICGLAAALALSAGVAGAETAGDRVVSIENEYIRIRVNAGPQEAGRFAVDTTGGDPSRATDNNQVLIYGSREPWTSYTTVLVDGVPHVFGGPSDRRAGRGAEATGLAAPPRAADGRIAASARLGDIEITQELSFARSPTTRVRDAALISYRIVNHGARDHTVGLRVVLDTMLGSNDGAPLRAGGEAIATATQLTGDAIPDFWQAFDSISQPAVISQGVLRAPGVVPPDRLEMVDWGTLADAPWEHPFPAGADFTRLGEEAQDTAVALYWSPAVLRPGESRSCATLYGVGGVSLSPAELSLGLTAPAEVDYAYDDERPFAVVAYVENSGGFASRDTKLAIGLSEGLRLVDGAASLSIGLLQPGQTRQTVWRVAPTGKVTGTLQITATVSSENLEPNSVARDIIVNSPPQLTVKLAAPERLSVTRENRYSPNPFELTAEVANRGAQAGRNLVVALALPDGLELADGGEPTRVADRIDPGKSVTFAWRVRALGLPTGELPVSLRATAAGAQPASDRRLVQVPRLTPEIRVHPIQQTVPALTDGQPTLVPVAVRLVPAREFAGARVSLTYDPAVVEPLYVSRGDAFVEAGRLLSPWTGGRLSPGRIDGIGGERGDAPALNAAEVTLFTVVFMVKEPGETALTLESPEVYAAASEQRVRIADGRIAVQPAE